MATKYAKEFLVTTRVTENGIDHSYPLGPLEGKAPGPYAAVSTHLPCQYGHFLSSFPIVWICRTVYVSACFCLRQTFVLQISAPICDIISTSDAFEDSMVLASVFEALGQQFPCT
jgi:hypothetical protein